MARKRTASETSANMPTEPLPPTAPYNLRSLHIPRCIRPDDPESIRTYEPTKATKKIQEMRARQESYGLPAPTQSKSATAKTRKEAAIKAVKQKRTKQAPNHANNPASQKRVRFNNNPQHEQRPTPINRPRSESQTPTQNPRARSIPQSQITGAQRNINRSLQTSRIFYNPETGSAVPSSPPLPSSDGYIEDDNEPELPVMSGALNIPSEAGEDIDDVSTPFGSMDIQEAAVNPFNSKEQFRKRQAKRQVKIAEHALREAREDVSIVGTDEIERDLINELNEHDISIGIDLRVYINKRKVINQTLQSISRNNLDLGLVEDQFHEYITPHIGDESYTIESNTAFVKTVSGRGRQLTHQLSDFSTTEALRVGKLLKEKRQAHPGSQLCILFEVKVDCPGLLRKRTNTLSATHQLPNNDNTTSPTASQRITRTTKLLEEASARQERMNQMSVAGDFQRQLMEKYQCDDNKCTNYKNFCYRNPMEPSMHFNIISTQHELWANSISRGNATLETPPAQLIEFWRKQQGSITRESRQPIKKNNAQIMEQFMDMQRSMMEQQMQLRVMSQMESMQEDQERRDAKKERCQLLDDQYSFISQPPPRQQSILSQPALSATPITKPEAIFNPFGIPVTPTPRPKSSSPIDPSEEDFDILTRFFSWKINNTRHEERRARWEHAKTVTLSNDWSIDELRQMEDGNSAAYQRAIKAGISDGIARGFKSELHKFKPLDRLSKATEQANYHAAAAALGSLGNPR